MAEPWLPPYFGSYEAFVNALLHNPFLGGGGSPHPHVTHLDTEALSGSRESEPVPTPWMGAVTTLVSAAVAKELASSLPEGDARTSIETTADRAVDQFIDDYCGTPPRRVPWPWPGPPPWVAGIASALTLYANSLQPGSLRDGIAGIAARVMHAGFGGEET